MEPKYSRTFQDGEKDDDNENQQPFLEITKYNSRSQIFNDNDSFIAIEEQAMRENEIDGNSELKIQELQNEISQLKINLNEAIEEKNDALTQFNLKNSEIESLNETVQNLETELKTEKDKNAAINRQLSEQRDLNSDLSLRLQELTEALNDKDTNTTSSTNEKPDNLIYRVRALELQLASSKLENDNLREEIETREKHFIDEISRLSQEISLAHSANPVSQLSSLPSDSNNDMLENEIAALRSQLDMMTESQKKLSESLQQQIETNSRLNTDLSTAQKNLEKNINENANSRSIIKTLLEITNLSNPIELIFNYRLLQTEKNEAKTARQQLCQLQLSYDKEIIINENLRKELSSLQDHFLNEISEKEKEKEKEMDEPSFNQNFIHEIKSEYESRLTAERARTQSQKKKIDAIRIRDRQIAEKFSSVPARDHTDMIQSLIAIFETLSANTDSISNSTNDNIEAINDHLLDSAIEEAQGIALKLVPHDFLIYSIDKMQLYQKYLNEIFAKTIDFSGQFNSLKNKFKMLERNIKRPKQQNQNNNQIPKFSRPPTSSSKLGNRSDVMINRNSNNNSNNNNDSTFNFNLNPNHSSLSFSRSPINGLTPKSSLRRVPFAEKNNGVSPSTLKWKPRDSPSHEFGGPEDLF